MKLRQLILIVLLVFTVGLLVAVAVLAEFVRSGPQIDTIYYKTATSIQITNNYVETAIANTLTATVRPSSNHETQTPKAN